MGNSSDEVLAHTFFGLLQQSSALKFPDITYSFYPVYCQLYGIDYEQVALADDYTVDLSNYNDNKHPIILANPNAPTGLALSTDQIQQLLIDNPDHVVVVDEAYADFSNCSAVSLVNRFENLLVVQTLSKSRSLAGLRVGFALGNAQLIAALERVKNSFHPYALDRLSLAGATAAFLDADYFQDCCNKIIRTREIFSEQLENLGFKVLPSAANFVFVQHDRDSCA